MKFLRIIWPFLLSPLLVLDYYVGLKLQYKSAFIDTAIQYSGAVVSIVILICYRRAWQYLLSYPLMAIFTMTLGPVLLKGKNLGSIFSAMEMGFIETSLAETLWIHVLAFVGFWFFQVMDIYQKKKRVIHSRSNEIL